MNYAQLTVRFRAGFIFILADDGAVSLPCRGGDSEVTAS
jgi:hypothetical protein